MKCLNIYLDEEPIHYKQVQHLILNRLFTKRNLEEASFLMFNTVDPAEGNKLRTEMHIIVIIDIPGLQALSCL